ncbi:carbon storage regulator [Halalkalibacter oceani]|uniref:carbon storage regulator n=1 Tax=Halalkalibacter oceani TaxID=1653776 RepID=UPI003394AE63
MGLVIGRKEGEAIIIGDLIRIEVFEENGLLRLDIDAPKEINIVREEIYNPKNKNSSKALYEFAKTHEKLFKPSSIEEV